MWEACLGDDVTGLTLIHPGQGPKRLSGSDVRKAGGVLTVWRELRMW